MNCLPPFDGTNCQTTGTPAGNGSFSQNVQRLGLYAMDTWRVTPQLTINYGLRWDTTFGLFQASGVSQLFNPACRPSGACDLPLPTGVPHDYRKAFAPRLGIAYSPDSVEDLVIPCRHRPVLRRSGAERLGDRVPGRQHAIGISAVHPARRSGMPAGRCRRRRWSSDRSQLHTPYSLHVSGGVQYQWHKNWTMSADYVHEQGVHGYRRYDYTAGYTLFSPLFPQDIDSQMANVPNMSVFKSDNRSSYNAMMLHVQGNVTHRFNLTANYVLSSAKTWGCVLGELWDYVNGVCNPLNPFAPGDYGPSGEDVISRFTLAGIVYVPGGFQVTTLIQAESAPSRSR